MEKQVILELMTIQYLHKAHGTYQLDYSLSILVEVQG